MKNILNKIENAPGNQKMERLKHTWMVQDGANELNQYKETIYHHCNR